jgi:hypothetical protein
MLSDDRLNAPVMLDLVYDVETMDDIVAALQHTTVDDGATEAAGDISAQAPTGAMESIISDLFVALRKDSSIFDRVSA